MTLTIMALWVVGIALLVGVAVVRGRATAKHKSHAFAPLDTASADAISRVMEATLWKTTKDADRAYKGVWVKSEVHRTRSTHGEYVISSKRSPAGSPLTKTSVKKPSDPAKGKEPLAR